MPIKQTSKNELSESSNLKNKGDKTAKVTVITKKFIANIFCDFLLTNNLLASKLASAANKADAMAKKVKFIFSA